MPLPPQAIEHLTREPVFTPGWSRDLLMFSGTLFAVVVFLYLGLTFGYRPYIVSQVHRLDAEIQDFSKQIPVPEQQKLIRFSSQIENIRTLLGAHVAVTPIFSWIERNAHQNVFFTRFSLDVSRRQLALGGTGRSTRDIAEQLSVFQAQPETEQVELGKVGSNAPGAWQFDATIVFEPHVFSFGALHP